MEIDLLIGKGGVTIEALKKITQCTFSLRCNGTDGSCISITGGSRTILDHGIDAIFDTLAKGGVGRIECDQIKIINEWESQPKKKPRRR